MSGKTTSQKEMTAVIVNLKEARILDKSMQTLSLEESYASKLLDLNSKLVRFNYGRLRNNIGKIKSYLKPEDVAMMRTLESEGRLKSGYNPLVCSSSADKIAAAHKRLKLESQRRTVSALPWMNRERQSKSTKEITSSSETPRLCSKSVNADERDSVSNRILVRPTTTKCPSRRQSSDIAMPRPKTAFVLEQMTKSHKELKSHQPERSFSCHNDGDGEQHKPSKPSETAFGPDPYEERRKKYLEGENQSVHSLAKRKENFVCNIKKFCDANPSVVNIRPELTQEVIGSIDSMAERPDHMLELRHSKHGQIDYELLDNVLYCENPRQRDFYTRKLMSGAMERQLQDWDSY